MADDAEAIHRLVAQGIDPDFVPKTEEFELRVTPLEAALQSRCWNAAKALLDHGADGVPGIDDPNSRIMTVIRWGNLDVLTHVVKRYGATAKAQPNGVPIAVAAAEKPEMLKLLLESGADPNEPDQSSRETALYHALRKESLDSVRLLLKFGANPNAADRFGNFPIFVAIQSRSDDLVEALVKGRADVSVRNMHGQTPLHVAARYGDEMMIRLLVAHGARRDVKSGQGQTPLEVWRSSPDYRPAKNDRVSQLLDPTKAEPAQKGAPPP